MHGNFELLLINHSPVYASTVCASPPSLPIGTPTPAPTKAKVPNLCNSTKSS